MHASTHVDASEDVLTFWFHEAGPAQWFEQADSFDARVRERFGPILENARTGALDGWARSPRGRLALIIVLDQLSRNIHRNLGDAFAGDDRAQALCLDGLALGHDRELAPLERWFFYMPLEHAEDLGLQERCVAAFERLAAEAPAELGGMLAGALDYARRHRDVIARFGRFPHRNAMLGRPSTPEEQDYLAQGRWF